MIQVQVINIFEAFRTNKTVFLPKEKKNTQFVKFKNKKTSVGYIKIIYTGLSQGHEKLEKLLKKN